MDHANMLKNLDLIYYSGYNLRKKSLYEVLCMHSRPLNNSVLLVDLGIFRENIRSYLSCVSQAKLIPVLKDNAYGLGYVQIARVLEEFPEIDTIAVSHCAEALELRENGWSGDIVMLSSIVPFQIEAALRADITMTAARPGIVTLISEKAQAFGKTAGIYIKIDTGLHRIGLQPGAELDALAQEIKASSAHISVKGAFSHFADTDDAARTQKQYELFVSAAAQLEDAGIALPTKHISCSAAFELYPEYTLDALRIGRGLYMDNTYSPTGTVKEMLTWRSYVTAVYPRSRGDELGYGGEYRLDRDALVAVIGVGYGDGIITELIGKGMYALIRGRRCRVLCCCMDQCMIDVTGTDCTVGDEVTFFGYDENGQLLSSQAQAAPIRGLEGCGLSSALGYRVARVYVDHGSIDGYSYYKV